MVTSFRVHVKHKLLVYPNGLSFDIVKENGDVEVTTASVPVNGAVHKSPIVHTGNSSPQKLSNN